MQRKFYALLAKFENPDSYKEEILMALSLKSVRDMNVDDLQHAIEALNELHPRHPVIEDKWRKRVLASICGWLSLIGRPSTLAYAKALACQATGMASFNEIPVYRMQTLYNAFLKKQEDFKAVGTITNDELKLLAALN